MDMQQPLTCPPVSGIAHSSKTINPELSLPKTFEQHLDIPIVGAAYCQLVQEALDALHSFSWSRCLQKCDILLDITWEHLNTGHWKDVDITWRHAYTLVSWMKAWCQYSQGQGHSEANLIVNDLQAAIKTCDMGLLMGAPICNNILSKLVADLQGKYTHCLTETCSESTEHIPNRSEGHLVKRQKIHNDPVINPSCAVPVVELPSLEHFAEHFMKPKQPVIIEKAIDFWPALGCRHWSLKYLRQIAGCRTVPIEIGSKYTEDAWSQSLVTIGEFIDKFIENPRPDIGKGYLAQHQLFDQIPELRRDIVIPSYCGLGDDEDVDINAWFGPEGTVSPLHQDPKHNFLCQVVGEKFIRLYSTEHTALVYPHDDPLFSNTSQVDAEKPDLEKFPDFKKAPYLECVLKAGQMLYLPPKYWHYVRSLSVSFSVSFWWE